MKEVLLILCVALHQTAAHALIPIQQKEHKVHNIVLYPDKHSWCITTLIKQVVAHPGCKSVEIDNNVCVGACFSYSIPNTEPQTPGDVQSYCDSCQPAQSSWREITLECPDAEYGEDNVTLKRVEMISSCSCASCKDPRSRAPGTAADVSTQTDLDVPELMSLMLETHGTRKVKDKDEETKEVATDAGVSEGITERPPVSLKKPDDPILDLEALQEIRTRIEEQHHKIEDDLSIGGFIEKIKSEENVRVLDRTEGIGLDGGSNHSRHHRMPGPHHSLVYPTYSLDIAAELNEEELKSKASSSHNTPHQPLDEGVPSHHHVTSGNLTAHQHLDNNVPVNQHVSEVPSYQHNAEDNLIFSSSEEKMRARKMENSDEGSS